MPIPAAIDPGAVAAVLAAMAVMLLTTGLLILQAERAFSRRLTHFIADYAGEAARTEVRAAAREEPSLLEQVTRRLVRSRVNARLRRELIRAGSPLRPGQFVYLRLIGTALGGLLGYAASLQVMALLQPLLLVIGVIAGWMAPMSILRAMQRRRLAEFERHIPDAIDIMAGSLEAGSSLPMALELVAREIPPPVSTEFGRALREVSLGMSLEDALRNMLERIYSDDLDMLVTAVSIQYRVGGNLADVLKVIANTVRERVRIRADIQTLTAQQSISANVLTVLPIGLAVLLFILNPSYERRLFDPGFPQLATFTAVGMIALAYIILKRIIAIES